MNDEKIYSKLPAVEADYFRIEPVYDERTGLNFAIKRRISLSGEFETIATIPFSHYDLLSLQIVVDGMLDGYNEVCAGKVSVGQRWVDPEPTPAA